MNKDTLKGQWTQIKGEIKAQWGKLTDDELDYIDGESDKLVGAIQEKYGVAKEEIEKQIGEFKDAWRNRDNRF